MQTAQKYLLQFDRLVLKQGVLHCIYISNDVESHQLVLSLEYHEAVLHMLHDDWLDIFSIKPTIPLFLFM